MKLIKEELTQFRQQKQLKMSVNNKNTPHTNVCQLMNKTFKTQLNINLKLFILWEKINQ